LIVDVNRVRLGYVPLCRSRVTRPSRLQSDESPNRSSFASDTDSSNGGVPAGDSLTYPNLTYSLDGRSRHVSDMDRPAVNPRTPCVAIYIYFWMLVIHWQFRLVRLGLMLFNRVIRVDKIITHFITFIWTGIVFR